MTTSKYIKSKGLPSIEEASRLSHTPVNTLNNWYKSRRDRFEVLIDGALLRYIDEQLIINGIDKKTLAQNIAKFLRG